ncbi:hypothetical protein SAMN02745220_04830 [Desulfopila aestuarii DSM 18488]|uniref:Uncharacterized protein n=1 Tax=Desulfopila aestuarii DSM 18488 TaxID=1121416 RepID=A0A1M7YJV5_9BACT|nr:hypothetical protein SAMN02745220_04830 [Desulfopila aestuarii DSM 18488]
MLDPTIEHYLLKNGPAEIHSCYRLARSNNEDGFYLLFGIPFIPL